MKSIILALLCLIGANASAQTCTTIITTSTSVATAINSAAGGDVLCLRPGNYGYESINAVKSSVVLICSTTADGSSCSGQGAQMSMEIYRSNRLTFKSITFNGGVEISDFDNTPASKNLTILNSYFGSGATLWINLAGNSNANFLFDGNTFIPQRDSSASIEGNVYTFRNPSNNSSATGVTFSNNVFDGSGSCSDGFNNTTVGGITIGPGNTFRDWEQLSCGPHVDAIQEFGGNVSYIGNYFTNNDVNIGMYDGASNITFSNSVFNGQAKQNWESFQIGSVAGMTFSHNTVIGIEAGIGSKSGNPPNSSWVIENNIFVGSNWNTTNSFQDEGCGSGCVIRYNLINSTTMALGATPTNTVTGAPTFSGGATPSTWQGWRLSVGSNGKAAGNDGKDMGTNYFNPAAPTGFN